jgi:hypothetical protein
VRLPVSPAAGPAITRGGLASGFADTPLGALLAAVNIAVRANAQWGPAIFAPTIRGQVTGPDAAALLAGCQDAYQQGLAAAGVPAGQPLGRAYVTEEAYRFVAYTSQDATVDVVSAGPGDQGATVRAVTRIEVWWRGGDWRVVARPPGRRTPAPPHRPLRPGLPPAARRRIPGSPGRATPAAGNTSLRPANVWESRSSLPWSDLSRLYTTRTRPSGRPGACGEPRRRAPRAVRRRERAQRVDRACRLLGTRGAGVAGVGGRAGRRRA